MAIIGTPTYVIQKDLIKLIIPSNEVAIFQSDNQKKIKYHLETFEMTSRVIELVLCGECNILENKNVFRNFFRNFKCYQLNEINFKNTCG